MKGISQKAWLSAESELRNVLEMIEALKDSAESYKAERSEKWAESDAGEEYENKIEQLAELIDSLQQLVDEFAGLMTGD